MVDRFLEERRARNTSQRRGNEREEETKEGKKRGGRRGNIRDEIFWDREVHQIDP